MKLVNKIEDLKEFIKSLGVDIYGFADLRKLKEIPLGLSIDFEDFIKKYPFAIVLGTQVGKLGSKATGTERSLFLESNAFHIMNYFEDLGYKALIIHTEDEFDPHNRLGFISLKALAKTAGLGWQGRSLLIISPEYGPIHRLIAVLTNFPLEPNMTIENKCGNCRLCVDACPQKALNLVMFEDHPITREEVLDINTCLGDNGCMVCIKACPWLKKI